MTPNPFSLEEFSRSQRNLRRRRTSSQVSSALATAPFQPDEFGVGDYLLDGAGGVVRGVGSFLHGAYGAVDILSGDSLPDFDAPLQLGGNKTAVGGLTQGLTNFALGFLPMLGWAGRGMQIGRLRPLGFLANKPDVATGLGKSIAQGTAAGVMTDLLFIDGHEARLSNLLSQHHDLEIPIVEFLKADPDDHKAFARLKGALEGAVLGGVADAVALGVRALSKGRRVRTAGGDATAHADEIQKGIDEDRMRDGLVQSDNQLLEQEARIRDRDDDFSPFEVLDRTAEGDDLALGQIGGRPTILQKSRRKGDAREMWFEVDENGRPFGGPLSDDLNGATRTLLNAADNAAAASAIRTSSPLAPGTEFLGSKLLTPDGEKDIVELTTARLKADQGPSLAINPRKTPADELESVMLQDKDLNLLQMSGDEAVVTRSVEQMLEPIDRLGGGRVSEEDQLADALGQVADLTGLDGQSAAMQAAIHTRGARAARIQFQAHRIVLMTYAKETKAIMRKLFAENEGIDGLQTSTLLQYSQAVERMMIHTRAVRGMSAEFGRGLQSGNIPFMDALEAENFIHAKGGRRRLLSHAKKLDAAMGDGATPGFANTAGALKQLRGSNRFFEITHEAWINSVLFGFKTWSVNLMGNSLVAVTRPMERMVGGLLTGNSQAVRHAAAEYANVASAGWEFVRLFGLQAGPHIKGAWRAGTGRGPDEAVGKAVETAASRHPAIAAENFPSLQGHPILSGAVNYLGKTVRLPAAVLQGEDALFRQMAWRSTAQRKFMDEALDRGLSGHEASQFVNDYVDQLIEGNQLYSREVLLQRGRKKAVENGVDASDSVGVEKFAAHHAAQQWDSTDSALLRAVGKEAREVGNDRTFTTPLRKGDGALSSIGRAVQDTLQYVPVLRFVAPFIRTPVNLLKYGLDRSVDPVIGSARFYSAQLFGGDTSALAQSHSRFLREILSENPAEVAEATGRLATSAVMITAMTALVDSGMITGAGPSDPEQRRLAESAGWLPYSFHYDGTYVQYTRMDPFATVIGIVADLGTASKWAHADDTPELERAGLAVMTALANNVVQKSYLQGLNNFMRAMVEPDQTMGDLVGRWAAGFVPRGPAQVYSAFRGADPVDDTMREARTIAERMMAKIPYYGQNMAPVRNFMGEVVHRPSAAGSEVGLGGFDPLGAISTALGMALPIAHSTVTDKLVERELITLKHSFRPPRRRMGTVDLDDFRNQNGQTAYDRWMELHGQVKLGKTDMRRALRDLIRSDFYKEMPEESTFEVQTPRIDQIDRVVGIYRRYAKRQMMNEFPQLQIALALQRSNQNAARLGQPVR